MNVKIYSTPTCPWCAKTKAFLKEHGVAFTDFDVSKDRAAAEEMVRVSGQMGVPVTDINGKIIVGFDEASLKSALNIK